MQIIGTLEVAPAPLFPILQRNDTVRRRPLGSRRRLSTTQPLQTGGFSLSLLEHLVPRLHHQDNEHRHDVLAVHYPSRTTMTSQTVQTDAEFIVMNSGDFLPEARAEYHASQAEASGSAGIRAHAALPHQVAGHAGVMADESGQMVIKVCSS